MDPIVLILAVIIIGLIYLLKEDPQQKELVEAVERFPGPKRYPIVGTNFGFLLKPKEVIFQLIAQRVKDYGSPHKAWMGKLPMINLSTPEDVELILNNSVQIKKGHLYKFIRPWLLDGLLTSYGAYWHKNRKLITPTFHFSILEQFVEVFDEKSRSLVSKLTPQANGQVFNIYPDITHCALDIICETAMGVTVNAMDKPNSEYVTAVYGISKLATDRAFLPWYHSDFVFYRTAMGKQFLKYVNILHGFTEKVIKDRKAKLNDTVTNQQTHEDEEFIGKKKRKAFLDMLLEASKGGTIMNDLEIRQEVDTFMFEGHDTTTAAICWTLFLLGNNPEIQEKAFREQEEIFHGEDRPVTMKDLGEMKYLERVIKETLRLYPSVPFIGRILTEELVVNGVKLPKNVGVVVQIYHLHHNPKVYPDPEKFDPDRFLPENSKNRHAYAYIPFSAGPRNCIGQKFAILEEKTVLSAIIRNFKIRSAEKQEDIKLISELILRPKNGVKIMLEKRN